MMSPVARAVELFFSNWGTICQWVSGGLPKGKPWDKSGTLFRIIFTRKNGKRPISFLLNHRYIRQWSATFSRVLKIKQRCLQATVLPILCPRIQMNFFLPL